MIKKQEQSKGYIMLWVLVIFLTVFIVISHIVYLVGQGRWVCTEYETNCIKCETAGINIVRIDNQELEMKWHTENKNMCYCTEYETECINEVWTRRK